MTKSIDFYFDFISPYSYLAHKKIQIIKKKKHIKFNYKPVLVGGLHNLLEITPPAFIKAKLKHIMSDCDLIAKKEKLNFTWNFKFPLNSLTIMRGYLVTNDDFKDLYLNTMFDAYWKNNLDISDEKILRSLLRKCKIQIDIFFTKVKDQKIKHALKDLTQEAHDKEIFGVPTFVVNDKVFWGQDRLKFAMDEYNK